MSAYRDKDPRIHGIQSKIRVVPNFPKPGSSVPSFLFFIFLFCKIKIEKKKVS